MGPDLTENDRARFESLRHSLEGVSRDTPSPNTARPGPIDPMLASTFEGDLSDLDEASWIAEQKYDGTRIILQKFDGDVRLYTRRHVERSDTLPELTATAAAELPDGVIIDGEYTYLTPGGKSRFVPIHASEDAVGEENLAEQFFVFDILAIDGTWCTRDPLMERRERLSDILPSNGMLQLVDQQTGRFQSYFDRLVGEEEEGIILKRRDSGYHVDTRSDHWQKVKAFTERDVIAVGFTPGEGRRSGTFGALVMTDGEQYIGRVGSGFSDSELRGLREEMTPVDTTPVREADVGMAYTPVEPFVIQVRYQEVTSSADLRAPVFLRLRPEKPLEDVQPIAPDS